ncbi:hypothetical protein Ancab_012663 [Ancistrocladus abbreviatus]
MGCICSKGISAHDYVENHTREKEVRSSKRFITSRRDEVVVETDGGGNDATTRLISDGLAEENVTLTPIVWEDGQKNKIIGENPPTSQIHRDSPVDAGHEGQMKVPRIPSVPNGVETTQVAAGWPSWLTAVAGEAISGLIPRRADSFQKLEKIGQGTYSSVYRAQDLETGNIVAMKKVRFVNMDPESVRFMAREIHILRKLDHPNVMKLECLVASRVSGNLYLVFEYMEHDLAGLAARPGVKFTEPQIKCYMQQLLRGLEHCHSHGILHRDIKGSNLLIDDNGNLKIGDFGLAILFQPNQKQPLTSRVVTLWYRPPELLLGSTNYGVGVDLWSAGCILAELFHGKPIMPGRTEVEQLHKIFKLCGSPSEEYWKKSRLPHATIFKPQNPYRRVVAETFKDFPSSALALLDVLLSVEPEHRGSASVALQSEFFTSKPLPCDPSTLPKYPPSKEFDARRRDEEARRHKASANKGLGQESGRKDSRTSRAVPAPDANAELQVSIQKRYGLSNKKSSSEKFNREEDGGSGFRIEPPRGKAHNGFSHSGQLMYSSSFSSSRKQHQKDVEVLKDPGQISIPLNNEAQMWNERSASQGSSKLSRFATSVAVQGNLQMNNTGEDDGASNWSEEHFNVRYNHQDHEVPPEKHDWSHHLLDRPNSSNKKDDGAFGKVFNAGYAAMQRIHCSGPLLPAGGSIEEMLKEHEKKIQNAVRKAHRDKTKNRKAYSDSVQTESLLHGTKAR